MDFLLQNHFECTKMDFTNPSIFAFGVSIVYLMNKVEQLEKRMTKPDDAIEVNEINLLKMENERLKKELEEKEEYIEDRCGVIDDLSEDNDNLKEKIEKMQKAMDEYITNHVVKEIADRECKIKALDKEHTELKTKLENLENEYAEHVTKTFESIENEDKKATASRLEYEKKTREQIERATKLEETIKRIRDENYDATQKMIKEHVEKLNKAREDLYEANKKADAVRQKAIDAWAKAEKDSDHQYRLRNNEHMGINYSSNAQLMYQKVKEARHAAWNTMFLHN